MSDQEKREKVIRGLEYIISSGNAGMRDDCANCAYPGGGDCLAPALRDALALLKAQEPRVMTLEEVAGRVALEQETVLYMEYGHNSTREGTVIGLIPKYIFFDDEHGLSWYICEGPDQGKRDGVSLYEYNDIWRCWTSRPDEKRRAETPWE